MHKQKETEKPHSEYVQRKALCQLICKKLEAVSYTHLDVYKRQSV